MSSVGYLQPFELIEPFEQSSIQPIQPIQHIQHIQPIQPISHLTTSYQYISYRLTPKG